MRGIPRAQALLCAALAVLAAPAAAHRLAPALLELSESAPGRVEVRFKASRLQPAGSDLRPELPDHCRPDGDPTAIEDETSVTLRWTLHCDGPLVGSTVAVRGLEPSRTNALLRVALADGRRVRAVLHEGAASFRIPERESAAGVVRGYGALGMDHILTGFDHLLFVLGLVLLVRGRRALLATVTSFTVGHSVTLSLAALGFVHFPQDWTELVIAATILALAVELVRDEPSPRDLMRRWPWAMAGSFGLLHGLGFAGALAEVGLPAEEIPLALLSFNLGIELGQLVFVVSALLVLAALRPRLGRLWLERVPAYAIGGLAAFWCLDRATRVL